MKRQPRLVTALLLGASLLALTLLAAGLPDMRLSPTSAENPQLYGELAAFSELLFTPQTLLVLLACLLPFILFTGYLVVTSEGERRRRGQKRSLVFEALLWMLAFLSLRLFFNNGGQPQAQAQTGQEDNPFLDAVPFHFDPDPSSAASFLAGFLLLVLLAALAWYFWRRRQGSFSISERIGFEAAAALDELRSGGDFRSVILRCYAEMCQVLIQQRGIKREQGVTPREFETSLMLAGMPPQPVRKLTSLFERVRYGSESAAPEEEQEALSALEDIAEAARGAP